MVFEIIFNQEDQLTAFERSFSNYHIGGYFRSRFKSTYLRVNLHINLFIDYVASHFK